MKILTGAYHRDTGDIFVAGEAGAFQEPAREPRSRHRDDLPGLRALRKHGCRPEHLSRPLAAAAARSSTARRMYAEADEVLQAAEGQRQLGLPEGRKPLGRPPAIGRDRSPPRLPDTCFRRYVRHVVLCRGGCPQTTGAARFPPRPRSCPCLGMGGHRLRRSVILGVKGLPGRRWGARRVAAGGSRIRPPRTWPVTVAATR